MELTFHARYTEGREKFDGLDHYDGAQSLLGLSQVLLIALNAFFNKEILTQAPSAKGFRLVLGKGKVGSWDQAIQLLITSPDVLEVAKDLGKSGVYDLLKWALLSGVGLGHLVKNRKAKKLIRELEQKNEDLHERLDEALKRVHYPVKHQGLSVHVMAGRDILATFNDATLRHIETEVVHEAQRYEEFGVSRLNARTGTGRFIRNLDAASIPFTPQENLSKAAIRALGDSLGYLTRDKFVPVLALISEVTSADGHLKSYRLHSATPI
ncbi:DUF7946 domain-containing protein [Novosphingobium lindaniclasticum]|uniref:DUF7946 domain-containing protein n=1 Tax=Novosphingobium lindaniclasticum TaxID=1329895 RepID=UPI0012690BAB|nr:hypothetical protein [Novosphingobium lindaniclasticum]